MTLAVRATDQGPIPEAIHKQLWECVSARLQRGDSLIRPLDFQRALEADYTALTGVSISESVRRWLAHAQVTSNRENPDRYVALGVRNSVRRAFQSACAALLGPGS